MALIGQIRKNSWILVVLIALGLGGFIIMDMTSGQQSIFGSQQTIVGKIAGEKVDWNRFARIDQVQYEVLYRNSGADAFVRRNALWNYFVEEAIVQKEAENLGLGVSKTELLDLEFGPNPSPIIAQRFQDPTTRQINRQQLNEFKTAIENNQMTDPLFTAYWRHQEEEVIKDRLQSKINGMVAKAMYTPTWMAEMGHKERNLRIDFTYVKVPFDEIDNTEVTLDDSDFAAYIKENDKQYRQDEETRRLKYVTFDIIPTAEDSAKLKGVISELVPEFQQAENDSSFVEINQGQIDGAYFKKEEVSPFIADTVFSLAVGSVYGPYTDGNLYQAVKVVDRKIIPDSVEARHILLRAQDQATLLQSQRTIDSLKNLIQTGQQTFDSLALAFGTDGTRDKGGDLGWAAPGQMVKPFNDLIFFQAEEGKLYTVLTQFGIHLVEVTGKKFVNNEEGVQLAFLSQPIVPSEETINNEYEKVLRFVGDNRTLDQLEESVNNNAELNIETSPWLKKNDFTIGTLGPGQESRNIVQWSFKASKEEVSPEIYSYEDPVEYFTNKYVIVGLETVRSAGLPKAADIKEEIEPLVLNEKKGELIKEQIQGLDMAAIAAKYSTQIDTASNVNFSSAFIPSLGNEPKLLGVLYNMEQDQPSQPVVGRTGVYVANITLKPNLAAATNIPQLRQTINSAARAQVPGQLMQAMKKSTDIKDYRSKFY